MASVGEHWTLLSDGDAVDALHPASVSHLADSTTDHDQPGTLELVDGDCCHTQGPCHLLASAGPITNISMSLGLSLASSNICVYYSLSFDTPLRPPTSA